VLAVAARWPGRVGVVLPGAGPVRSVDAGVRLDAAGVTVVEGDPTLALRALGADVARLPLDPRLVAVARALPSVVVAGTTAVQSRRYLSVSSRPRALTSGLLAARDLWSARALIDAAEGLQCDAWGPWAAYHEQAQRRHRVPPLLFFGSRAGLDDVARGRARVRRGPVTGRRLRLGFVGRLHPADGPQDALAASRQLRRRGLEHELVLVGSGALEARLRAAGGPDLHVVLGDGGEAPGLETLDASVDLALLPYRHAHSTGAELDLAALGIPVVGYRSTTLEGHRRFAGFTLPVDRRTPAGLARGVLRLVDSPPLWRATADRGVRFMARHHAGERVDQQVEHMLRVAGAVRSAL
jgi:glycosyltransferase involved in cell wall biosynthesis